MNAKPVHRGLLAALLAVSLSAPAADAGTVPVVEPSMPSIVLPAAGDCYAIGQSVAAQNGGTLAAARAAKRGGRSVCIVVVLIPGKNGQRPRRQEIIVPQ